MQAVFYKNNLLGTYDWCNGFRPARKEMTLREEVKRYGLAPVVKRMKRQRRWAEAAELLREFKYQNRF